MKLSLLVCVVSTSMNRCSPPGFLLSCNHVFQALSQALSQVRSDLVETARKTLEGEASREIQEANVKVLVEKRTKGLQVSG